MQVLKDEVRESIRTAAIKTFTDKGYRGASMREIASLAGMSVGNLYRYFKNKEEMFGYLVQPLIDMFLKANLKEQEFKGDMLDVNMLEHSEFIQLMLESRMIYREELFILFLRADDSPFAGAKEQFATFLEDKTEKFLVQKLAEGEIIKGRLFSKYLASAIVDTFCVVLEEAKDNEEFIFSMIEYGEYVVKPIIRNLIAVKNGDIKFRRISDEEIHRRFSDHRNHWSNCSTENN